MIQIRNTENRYGAMAMFLHWFMAVVIFFLLGIGLYMTRIPIGILKLKLFGWHKEWGILILMLVVVRLAWHLINITPLLPAHIARWQKFAAHSVHFIFYVLMFLLPITGWMLSSAAGFPVSFFGLFVLPDLVSPNEELRLWLTTVHAWLAYGLILVICMHVAAALEHHFIYKDDILRRMLP